MGSMAILEKEVWVRLGGTNYKHYESLGYEIPRYVDNQNRLSIKKGTKILVKIEHIPKGSQTIKVTKICDECGKIVINVPYAVIINSRKKGDGKDRCKSCVGIWTNGGHKVNNDNCLWATHPEIAKLLKYPDSGYELSYGSDKKEVFICDKCGHEQSKSVWSVVNFGLTCSRCADGYSYPEKFLISLLSDLNLEFETQKVFKWSKNVTHENKKLSGKKRYDFFLPEPFNMIIEVHGMQHYEEGFYAEESKSLEEEQLNDKIKMNLAIENNISNYIVIDCRYSNIEWMKDHILNSKLSTLFDLSNVDWNKCNEFTLTSMIKLACDLWEVGIKSTLEISKITKLARNTVTKYLKLGVEMGICDYEPSKQTGSLLDVTPVVQTSLSGKFIARYSSMAEAAKETGIKKGTIWACCKGKMKSIGDHRWFYKEEYEKVKDSLNIVEKTEYRKAIVQLDLEGNLIKEWKSATEASKEIGISNKSICYAMKKENKIYEKFKWMYKKDYEQQLNLI
jgi:hypothetical protein